MENITKAIVEVMKEVKNLEKTSDVKAGKGSYKGVKDMDVKKKLQPIMAKHGLCVLTTDIQPTIKISRWMQDGKSKQQTFTEVKTKYLLMHTSGETVEGCGYGHGVDSQDKGAGKATTYALKYFLVYLFLIPCGYIDDSDPYHSNEIDTPPIDPISEDEKPKEVYDPQRYARAAKNIKSGEITFSDIREKYTLSKAAEKTIQGLVNKL